MLNAYQMVNILSDYYALQNLKVHEEY